jgi:hypothetical protein
MTLGERQVEKVLIYQRKFKFQNEEYRYFLFFENNSPRFWGEVWREGVLQDFVSETNLPFREELCITLLEEMAETYTHPRMFLELIRDNPDLPLG